MNLKEISLIVNSEELTEDQKKQFIIISLSKSKDVIPDILKILESERNNNKLIISDLNVTIAKSLLFIKNKRLLKKDKDFIKQDIVSMYKKWKDYIKPPFLFKDEGLE